MNHGGRAARAAAPVVAALVALAFGASASQAHVSGSTGAPAAPVFTGYSTGVFHWSAVRRADHYDFQLANDNAKFNSIILDFATHSTSATLANNLADGKYWWRVRAVRRNGTPSRWVTRSFGKHWSKAPTLLSPTNGKEIDFPNDSLLLTWSPVLGAVQYEVAIARDEGMTTLVSGAQTVTTATSYIPPSTLSEGPYWWTVTPVDAEKHEGTRSAVHSFDWRWPQPTAVPRWDDLSSAKEFFDPVLSWAPVAGAAGYELDVNFSQDFNSSSRVCCSSTLVSTGYTPTKPLPNNDYFWRVRPINVEGANGPWKEGPSFMQFFDTIPPLQRDEPTISGLHVRDELGDHWPPEPPGWPTPTPILVWKPVAGASLYVGDVYARTVENGRPVCDIQQTAQDIEIKTPGASVDKTGSLIAWTPFGSKPGTPPYPNTGPGLEKGGGLIPGDHYCVRIRAVGDSDTTGDRVYGDYTYLDDAFTYSPSTDSRDVALPSSGDYKYPAGSATTGQTPLYTWRPIQGANSYWVIVARDPSFTTIVDYGFTRSPAYAPRRTLADEKTLYYWAVLPAHNSNGTGLPIAPQTGRPVDPLHANAAAFHKQSIAPRLVSPLPPEPPPAPDCAGNLPAPTLPEAFQRQFHWMPVDGTFYYRLEVSTDPNFSSLLDDIVTGSTCYVSNTTYPQSTLYWRVQSYDGDKTALTWSTTGMFKQDLGKPPQDLHDLTQSPSDSDVIPALIWDQVPGAISYDVRVVLPSGSDAVFDKVPTPAIVPSKLSGTGAFQWQVRARFAGGAIGPYSPSPLASYRRTVTPPTGARLVHRSHALVFSWQGRPGLKEYILQVATRPDFSKMVESDKTDGTVVASTLKSGAYARGGRFYWRLAAVDADGNISGYSGTKIFKLRKPRRH